MRVRLLMIMGIFMWQFSLLAQNHFNCNHDNYQNALQQDNLYQEQLVKYNQAFARYIINSEGNNSTSRGIEDILTLPTVIHYVQGEAKLELEKDLTDEEIAEILQGTNDLFRHKSGLSFENPYSGVDTEIEFCLVKTDPDQELTNGIVRHAKNINPNDSELYEFISNTAWDVTKYNNIYVFTESLEGYCSLYLSTFDVTLFSLECFASDIITHEMGHYLSLEHTFKDGCDNDFCLFDGDYVCDTPPKAKRGNDGPSCEEPSNSCDTDTSDAHNRNPYRAKSKGGMGDQPDMVENYMDNTRDCWAAFTIGQKKRMRFNIKVRRQTQLHTMACEEPVVEPVVQPHAVCDAIEIECGNSYTGSTKQSTYDNLEDVLIQCGSGGVGAPNEFYKLKGNDKEVTISLCESKFDTRIDIYSVPSGECREAIFTCVTGNDDSCKLQSRVSFYGKEGYDYYIMVHGYFDKNNYEDNSTGEYVMEVTCSTSSDCEEPLNIACATTTIDGADTSHLLIVQEFGSVIIYTFGNNTCTTSGSNPSCDPEGEIKDVWYKFYASATDIVVKLSLIGDNPAEKINFAVYDNCNGEEIACKKGKDKLTGIILTNLEKDRAYFIQVWSTQKKSGDFQIAVCEAVEAKLDGEVPIVDYKANNTISNDISQLIISPNPSKEETSVLYYLPTPDPVSLQVFDMNGQLVVSLRPQSNKGWNRVFFNVEDMAAGMYYVVFKSNQDYLTKKLMVLGNKR